MAIDESILNREPPLPTVAVVLNQLTSSQTIRALLVIVSSVTMAILITQQSPVPDVLTAVLFSVVGYYFGEAAPRPNRPNGRR